MAGDLAHAGVPVVLEPLSDVPWFDGLAARLDNATLLRQAGVAVVEAQRDAAHFRDLRQAAGNVVVWSGDPFEFSSRVERLFIRGAEVPLTSRQTELFQRYRKLPPAW